MIDGYQSIWRGMARSIHSAWMPSAYKQRSTAPARSSISHANTFECRIPLLECWADWRHQQAVFCLLHSCFAMLCQLAMQPEKLHSLNSVRHSVVRLSCIVLSQKNLG